MITLIKDLLNINSLTEVEEFQYYKVLNIMMALELAMRGYDGEDIESMMFGEFMEDYKGNMQKIYDSFYNVVDCFKRKDGWSKWGL